MLNPKRTSVITAGCSQTLSKSRAETASPEPGSTVMPPLWHMQQIADIFHASDLFPARSHPTALCMSISHFRNSLIRKGARKFPVSHRAPAPGSFTSLFASAPFHRLSEELTELRHSRKAAPGQAQRDSPEMPRAGGPKAAQPSPKLPGAGLGRGRGWCV